MKNLYTKLHAFQKEVGTIKKSEVNPFFKSRYVDINGIIDAIKPLLDKHGLVVMQPLTTLAGRPALDTVIADIESGENINTGIVLPENIDPQKMGSAITYFRRYALQSLLLLEAEDDDGTAASQTQNLPSRSDLKPAMTATRTTGYSKVEEPPLPEYNEAEEMARIMDGEVVVKKGEPVPFVAPKFRDCPHENKDRSSYFKCYNCYTKQQDTRT